jgi:hypothetical protein
LQAKYHGENPLNNAYGLKNEEHDYQIGPVRMKVLEGGGR